MSRGRNASRVVSREILPCSRAQTPGWTFERDLNHIPSRGMLSEFTYKPAIGSLQCLFNSHMCAVRLVGLLLKRVTPSRQLRMEFNRVARRQTKALNVP